MFRRFLVWLAAIAREGDALVFVEEHPVLGEDLPEDVVGFVGDFGWAYKGDVVNASKKSSPLPQTSGYATLVTHKFARI